MVSNRHFYLRHFFATATALAMNNLLGKWGMVTGFGWIWGQRMEERRCLDESLISADVISMMCYSFFRTSLIEKKSHEVTTEPIYLFILANCVRYQMSSSTADQSILTAFSKHKTENENVERRKHNRCSGSIS